MTDAHIRHHGLESILDGLGSGSGSAPGIDVRVCANFSHTNLRGSLQNEEFVRAVEAVMQHPLDVDANTFATVGERRIVWLGPDEWLVLAPNDQESRFPASLLDASQGGHWAVNDLSGGQILLRLYGDNVEALLAKGCSIDFHSSAFPVGRCSQTGLAKTNVLIMKVADDVIELIVRRSFSEYLVKWLAHAGRDSGISFGMG